MARLRHLIVVALMAFAVGALGLAGGVEAQTYPPAAITIVPSVLTVGQPFSITGVNFPAGTTVTITIDGQSFGTAVVNADGTFTFNGTTPALSPGTHTITATAGGVTASTTFEVVAGAGGGPGGAQVAGPLPRTGTSSTVPLARIGIALLAAGGLVVAMTHRSRRAARSHAS